MCKLKGFTLTDLDFNHTLWPQSCATDLFKIDPDTDNTMFHDYRRVNTYNKLRIIVVISLFFEKKNLSEQMLCYFI